MLGLSKIRTIAFTVGAIAACGAAVAAGVSTAYWSTHSSTTVSPDDYVLQPDYWVPMTVESVIARTKAGTRETVIQHRSANGSLRQDQRDSSGAAEVNISNVAVGKSYRLRQGQWIEQPLRQQKNGGKPYMVLERKTSERIPPDDPRVAALASVPMTLTFFQPASKGPSQVIFCPELNMLPVWMQSPEREQTVTSVVLGEPSVEFFPPSDASVEVRSDQAGIGMLKELASKRAPKAPQ